MAGDKRDTTTGPAIPEPRQRSGDEYGDAPTAPIEPDNAAPRATPDQPEPGKAEPHKARPAPPEHGPGSAGHALEHTRLGGTWVAVGCFAVVLLFLLFFILNNSNDVNVSYLGIHSRVPLGVALVLAAVCGALLVTFAGMARILQMRTRVRRHRRAQRKAAKQLTQKQQMGPLMHRRSSGS
jgi:uncharacterized integral membrane protein